VRRGVRPTVPMAAEAAKVSRATAYRYFPTQDALLSDAMDITPSLESVEAAVKGMTSQDVQERLVSLLALFNPIVAANESEYRQALRVYLDTWFETRHRDKGTLVKVRAGRRMRWLEQTLQPIRKQLSGTSWRRLKNALALTLGIDSIVIMKDVCGLEEKEALDVLEWTARIILKTVVREARSARKTGE
jgi:AcrR family transcriptional regulator